MKPDLVVDHRSKCVLDDVTPFGHIWIETNEEEANEPTIIRWLIAEQFKRPVRVIAFNTDEGWSRHSQFFDKPMEPFLGT